MPRREQDAEFSTDLAVIFKEQGRANKNSDQCLVVSG
jgi:hypothetical protein